MAVPSSPPPADDESFPPDPSTAYSDGVDKEAVTMPPQPVNPALRNTSLPRKTSVPAAPPRPAVPASKVPAPSPYSAHVLTPAPGANVTTPGGGKSGDRLLAGLPRAVLDGQEYPVLNKDICLIKKLGQGGMGAVYLGKTLKLGKMWAVKIMRFGSTDDVSFLERFEREARLAVQVESPHLVEVHDVGEESGLHYIVMEYVSGKTAAAWREQMRRAPISEQDVLTVCLAATRGLMAAHNKNIIHRDIKPENIFIPFADDGATLVLAQAKLGDLGLARKDDGQQQQVTMGEQVMGTPGFMAPEQINNPAEVGKPSDVFSMGVTLYTLLAGKQPWTGESTFIIQAATIEAPHPPLENLRKDLSPGTLAAIDRCLQKDPQARYKDAAELLQGLQAALSGQVPAQTPDAGPASRVNKQARTAVSIPRKPKPAPPPEPDTLPLQPAPAPPVVQPAPVPTPSSGWKLMASVVVMGVLGLLGGGGWLAYKFLNPDPAPVGQVPNPNPTPGPAPAIPIPPAPVKPVPPPAPNPGPRPPTPPDIPAPPVNPPNPPVVPVKYEVKLLADSSAGNCILRSKVLREGLASKGVKLSVTDNRADHDERLRQLHTGVADLAVFTIDSFVAAGARAGDWRAGIILVLSETQGADAVVAYKESLANLQGLNDSGARLVYARQSSGEFLARNLVAHFNLPNLPKPPAWSEEAASPQQVFDSFKGAAAKRAYVMREPYVSMALASSPSARVLLDSSSLKGCGMEVLVARNDFVRDHPDRVREMLEAYLRATYAYESQKGMAALVAQDRAEMGAALKADEAARLAAGIRWRNTQENYAFFGQLAKPPAETGIPTLESVLQKAADVLVKTGALASDPLEGRRRTLLNHAPLKDLERAGFRAGPSEALPGETPFERLSDSQWKNLSAVGDLKVPDITFKRGRAEIDSESQRALRELPELLAAFPKFYLVVDVHAGSDEKADRDLAAERAKAVADFLVRSCEVNSNRINSRPAAPIAGSTFSKVDFTLGRP